MLILFWFLLQHPLSLPPVQYLWNALSLSREPQSHLRYLSVHADLLRDSLGRMHGRWCGWGLRR